MTHKAHKKTFVPESKKKNDKIAEANQMNK